jgi:chemotaxis protein MotA
VNPATVIGLVVAFIFVLGSVIAEGGHLSALLNLPAAMVVFGGTFGAALVGTRMEVLKRLPVVVRIAFASRVPEPVAVCREMVSMARVARRDGFLGLERELPRLHETHPFMARALQLVADGTAPETVSEVLYTELGQLARRHVAGAGFLEQMGGLAPTLGVTGTVMGLVHMMGKLDDPSTMGPAIAGAFLATLYGVASANLIFLPLAVKLKTLSKIERESCEIVIEGARAIQRGDNPILVAEALKSFLPPGERGKLEGAGMDGSGGAAEGGDGERAKAA